MNSFFYNFTETSKCGQSDTRAAYINTFTLQHGIHQSRLCKDENNVMRRHLVVKRSARSTYVQSHSLSCGGAGTDDVKYQFYTVPNAIAELQEACGWDSADICMVIVW